MKLKKIEKNCFLVKIFSNEKIIIAQLRYISVTFFYAERVRFIIYFNKKNRYKLKMILLFYYFEFNIN